MAKGKAQAGYTPPGRRPAASEGPKRPEPTTAAAFKRELEASKERRQPYDRRWEQQRKIFGHDDARFTGRKLPQGQRDRKVTIDTYGSLRAKRLAEFLYNSVMTPTASFDLGCKGVKLDDLAREERAWLSQERDGIYADMMDLDSNFPNALAGVCHDLKYGAGFLGIFEEPGEEPYSRHIPLGQIWTRQDRKGRFDLFFWPEMITAREAHKAWGTHAGPKVAELCRDGKGETEVEFVYFCERNPLWNPNERGQSVKRWRMGYFALEDCVICEDGYSDTPSIQEFRLLRQGNEPFPAGPADDALEEMRQAQRVKSDTTGSIQKHTNPPYLVANQGVLTMTTHESRGEIIVDAEALRDGRPPVIQLPPTGNPQHGMLFLEEIHKIVDQHFFRHLIELPREPRMTVDQILGIQEESAKGTAPLVLPLLVGLQGCVMRMHDLRKRDSKVKKPDTDMSKRKLVVTFISPLARAALLASVNAYLRALQIAGATAKIDQRVALVADWLLGLRDTLLALGLNPELVPGRDELAKLKQAADEKAAQDAKEESVLNETTAAKNMAPVGKMLAELWANDNGGEAAAA